jgi:hypothetical protein
MVDNPITRKEKYLAKLTGSYTGNVPAPITRVEKYLYDLCQKGISGLTPEEIENAVNKYLEGKDYVTKTDADKAYQPAGSYLSETDSLQFIHKNFEYSGMIFICHCDFFFTD